MSDQPKPSERKRLRKCNFPTKKSVIVWTEAEIGVLGILVFIVTLKLVRLIRFNTHVAVFLRTLKVSSKLLLSYMADLPIGFMAFLHFGILIFGAGSEKYSSGLKATYFQLEIILGRVKARPINELSDANDTFGRIFAALLLISLTIMFMNFFLLLQLTMHCQMQRPLRPKTTFMLL